MPEVQPGVVQERGLPVGTILASLGAVFRSARFDACRPATAIGEWPLHDDEIAYCHMRGDPGSG